MKLERSFDCTVVVPVYNSAATLPLLVSRVRRTLDAAKLNYELIFVDDGSKDASWETLKRLRIPGETMTLLRLTRNFGQHKALLCGFKHARGAAVVTLDDDLQHPPEEIPRLLAELHAGHDLVYGVYRRRKHSVFRNLTSALAKRLLCLAIPGLDSRYSSFRCLRLWAAHSVAGLNTPFSFVDGSLTWFTRSVSAIQVEVAERVQGDSGYGFWGLCGYTLDILTSFSSLPLRLATVAGAVLALGGIGWGSALVARHLLHNDLIPGYTSTMAVLLFLGGLILATLGVNGEYVARINDKTSGRPDYAVRERLVVAPARRVRGRKP